MVLRILGIALAAWVSGGAVTLAGGVRVGVVPSAVWLIAALVAAASARRVPVAVLALVLLLPWVPLPVPPAFLLWTSHVAAWVWLLIAAAAIVAWLRRSTPTPIRSTIGDPRRAPAVAFATAALLFLIAAWSVSPQLPSGDEPHYLVIAQSLLKDHDLTIENNHLRGDYREYFSGTLRPDYLRRGRNGQIYSIHAPGLPAIVAPMFALLGYRGVTVFLSLVAAAATAGAWRAAWLVTGDVAAAWFGWATVALAEPFFVQSFMVYPDAPAGAIVIFAVLTMLLGANASRRRLAVTGIALAILPWLHTRAAVLSACLGLLVAARQIGAQGSQRQVPIARIAVLLAAPILSAAAWFAFFYVVYGTPDPRAPYGVAHQMGFDTLPRGVVGLLFDQQFGLLPNAPGCLCALVGFGALGKRHRRVTIELIAAAAPYAATVAAFQMWWAGYTTPARFLVPILLPLAIPSAAWFAATRTTASRVLGLFALALSALVTSTIVFVDRGALLLNFRDGSSRLLVWLSPVVNLTTAAPSLFQNEPGTVLLHALVWLCGGAVLALAAWAASRRRLHRDQIVIALGSAAAAVAMTASTIVWRTNHTPPVKRSAATLAFLSTVDVDSRQIATMPAPFRRLRLEDVVTRLPIVDARPLKDDPLVDVRHVPAGTYAVELTMARPAAGKVTATLDRSVGPMWAFDVAGVSGTWRAEFPIAVAAPMLRIDADPSFRSAIDRVTLRARSIPGSSQRLSTVEADHAARRGQVALYHLRGAAFVEPDGAWVQGGSESEFAIVADDRRPVRLLVRTPPVPNRVTFDGTGWHQELILAAGEARTIDLLTPRVRIAVANGARPADFEPGSTDQRLLGCWIEPR